MLKIVYDQETKTATITEDGAIFELDRASVLLEAFFGDGKKMSRLTLIGEPGGAALDAAIVADVPLGACGGVVPKPRAADAGAPLMVADIPESKAP
jgi:hypothetical protein